MHVAVELFHLFQVPLEYLWLRSLGLGDELENVVELHVVIQSW